MIARTIIENLCSRTFTLGDMSKDLYLSPSFFKYEVEMLILKLTLPNSDDCEEGQI